MWRARATAENAGRYVRHAAKKVFPALRAIEGHHGACVLRRKVHGDIEIVVLTLWEPMETVCKFAGPEPGLITPLVCSMVGQQQSVHIRPDTRACELYGSAQATEDYYCNYGVNSAYRHRLEEGGLTVSGTGTSGEIRIVELKVHPFFIATLFLPQTRSSAASPHPVIAGYAAAIRARSQ